MRRTQGVFFREHSGEKQKRRSKYSRYRVSSREHSGVTPDEETQVDTGCPLGNILEKPQKRRPKYIQGVLQGTLRRPRRGDPIRYMVSHRNTLEKPRRGDPIRYRVSSREHSGETQKRKPKQIQGVLQGTPQTKTPKITQGVLQSGTFRGTPQRRTPNRTQGVMQGKLRRTPQKRTPKGIQGFFQGTLRRTPQRTQGVLYIFLGVIFLPWFTSSLYILRNIPVVIVFIVMLNDSQLISPLCTSIQHTK